ncbi:MAG TPA: recombinase family protein [Paenibacillus sp.]|jgi:DNA invertase Pin-like site-specific DNA recombinase
MIIVAGYGRVSTKHDDQLNSLEAQIDHYTNYTNDKEGMELYKMYHDSLSATRWENRKGFRELLHDAGLDVFTSDKGTMVIELSDREPLFTKILVKDVSRFTRNVNDNRIFTLLRDKGVYIDFTNMNLSTENMSEETMLQIMMVFSQRESQDRSEKVLFGLKESAKKGRIRMRDNLYGYRYMKESNSLEIIETEAEVVRLIFRLYLEGNGVRKIMNYLEDNNIQRNGKPFAATTLKRIISNPVYKGTLIRNKMASPLVFSNKKSATLKDDSEWEVFEDRIPSIIDIETFDSAQLIRGAKVNHKNKNGLKPPTGKYAGLVKCGKCGKQYTQNKDSYNGRVFLNCKTKKTKGTKVCKSINITISWLDEAVDEFVDSGLESTIADFKESYVVELELLKEELYGRIDNQQVKEAEELKEKIEDVKLRKKRLATLFVSGSFDEETLESMAIDLDQEYEILHEQYTRTLLSNDEIYIEIKDIDTTITSLHEFKIKAQVTRENVLRLISSITIKEFEDFNNDDGLKVYGKGVQFDFEFRIFERLNEIVEKYKLLGKVYTRNIISVVRHF